MYMTIYQTGHQIFVPTFDGTLGFEDTIGNANNMIIIDVYIYRFLERIASAVDEVDIGYSQIIGRRCGAVFVA